MSVKTYTPLSDSSFRVLACTGGGKALQEAERSIVLSFEETKDSKQLRKNFYRLRARYVKECLIAYVKSFEGSYVLLDIGQLNDLLWIKFRSYEKIFDQDLGRLFKNSTWKNNLTRRKFAREGKKVISQLIEGT